MEKRELIKLRKSGYTYLVKISGQQAFMPLKGNENEALKYASQISFCEDEVLSISDAIIFYDNGFQYEDHIFIDYEQLKSNLDHQ